MYLLLGTSGCHLCEEALEIIHTAQASLPITYTEIDIAEQTQWQERYAIKIPVLLHKLTGRDLCWPFTATDLINFHRATS